MTYREKRTDGVEKPHNTLVVATLVGALALTGCGNNKQEQDPESETLMTYPVPEIVTPDPSPVAVDPTPTSEVQPELTPDVDRVDSKENPGQPEGLLSREFTARGYPIPEAVQVERNKVYDLCESGEGSDEAKHDWEHFSFDKISGVSFTAAVLLMGDQANYDSHDVHMENTAELTYAAIAKEAKTCLEAGMLASSVTTEGEFINNFIPAENRAALDQFRNDLPYDPTTRVMGRASDEVIEGYDKGVIDRPTS